MTHHQHAPQGTEQYGQSTGGYGAGSPGQAGQQTGGTSGGTQQMGGMGGQRTGGMAGQQTGGMQGQQASGAPQTQGTRLGDALTPEMQTALSAFADAEDVCEWCAEQCIASGDPHMMECIRLCRDVSDLAGVNQKFLARDSRFGQEAAAVFQRAARECARECAQHADAHCQECARVLERAADATESMLRALAGETTEQPTQARQSPRTGQPPQTGQTPQAGTGGRF